MITTKQTNKRNHSERTFTLCELKRNKQFEPIESFYQELTALSILT